MTYIKINFNNFYDNYYGHSVKDLTILKKHLDTLNKKRFVYLVGDSSLDNKHWFDDTAVATNGYESIISNGQSKCDIAHHMNDVIANSTFSILKQNKYTVINCAVEESTIGMRNAGLLDQDKFARENMTKDDVVIVSLGGNDVALSPTANTIFNMVKLQYMNSEESIKNNFPNCWGADYFINLFKDQLTNYLTNLTFKTKPKKIIVCCIYYPDENQTGGWQIEL